MGALGNIINQSVNSAADKTKGTSIQDFLANFSSANGALAKIVDPYSSFDLFIKFEPTFSSAGNSDDKWYKKLGNSVLNSAKQAVNNAANNLTGGLLGSIMGKIDIPKKKDDFKYEAMSETFLEYLASANLIVGQEGWVGESAGQAVKPLVLSLGVYCQSVMIPNIQMATTATQPNSIGEFVINGRNLSPDNHILKIQLVNTRVPLMERIFYPWAREVVSPIWQYASQPYTTATVTVDMTKHSDTKYVFYGCRPQQMQMMQATQANDTSNLKREVSLIFDYMIVVSGLNTVENFDDMLMDTGSKLAAAAGSLVNI